VQPSDASTSLAALGPVWSSSRTAQARSDSARVVTSAALFMIAVVSGFGPRDDPFP
jgi:hypothetical protein